MRNCRQYAIVLVTPSGLNPEARHKAVVNVLAAIDGELQDSDANREVVLDVFVDDRYDDEEEFPQSKQ
jgi:hypothetical protein